MQELAPIALFVYNRPEHTKQTLAYLAKNELAANSKLFIFSDAAQTSKEAQKVDDVRNIIKKVKGFLSVEIIHRSKNWGLANSIIDGVTQLVNEYGKVIVFEDDLLSSPHTLKYFNESLAKYEDRDEVMHVGAYMYPLKTKNLPEAFFYRATSSWGWATWKRAWSNFEPNIETLIAQFDKDKIHQFSIEGAMNFWKQINEFNQGKNNSWAIRWYASVFLKNGLALNPAKSFISNIGTDGSGVHSGVSEIYHVEINEATEITKYPEKITENQEAYQAIKTFLKYRKGSLFQRIRRFSVQQLAKWKK